MGTEKARRKTRKTISRDENRNETVVAFDARFGGPPQIMEGVGWKARGDRRPEEKRVPFNRPTARQVYDALPFVRRYFMYWVRHTGNKERLFINTFQPLQHKPYYGVPCGGIGSGSIGRDFRGGFCKFGLRPGMIEHKINVVPADQFIISVRRPGESEACYQKVLCAADVDRSAGQLSSWDFDFPESDVSYRGLYPRSWTTFYIPDLSIVVTLRQVSSVIPHEYVDSSLPVAVFVFDVDNRSDVDYEVSLAFTFRNGTGYKKWETPAAECSSREFVDPGEGGERVHGITLTHNIAEMKCTYGLAVRTSDKDSDETAVSICRGFAPSSSGVELWRHLKENGDLPDHADGPSPSEQGVGVCIRTSVAAGETKEGAAEFALAWDMPAVKFGDGGRTYHRRYTRQFERTGEAAPALCAYSLRSRARWEAAIEEWQRPVIDHPHLPAWYKSALFNELYFITDGGSVWFEYDETWREREGHLSAYSLEIMKEYGRFGYLESWEYRMVNTYDVHFYASFALAHLWPQLELSVQSEFTDHVEHVDDVMVRFHMEGDRAYQKTATRVPHDLGNPATDPWLLMNAYVMHDTGKWKDLNLKYVLTSWRDYVVLTKKDRRFLDHVWPAVKSLIEQGLASWDQDGDGMIENFGKADQTYDAWQMEGVSAYCGSLWLASLRVAEEMAREAGDAETLEIFTATRVKARQVFIDKLWNGTYFRFCERSKSRDTVMADQLCGIWFLQSVSPDMAAELLPPEYVSSALKRIFDLNVMRFGEGRMGAVNGMKPDGKIDRAYIQADEMWTGVTYAVAAFMIQQGNFQEAFDTAFGSYDACFNRFGLQYQTPEALYEKKFYRAIGYMRPLAIWAMQWALERHAQLNTKDEKSGLALMRPRMETVPGCRTPCNSVFPTPTSPCTVHLPIVDPTLVPKAMEEEDGVSEGYGSDEKESSKGAAALAAMARMGGLPSAPTLTGDNGSSSGISGVETPILTRGDSEGVLVPEGIIQITA